MATRINSKNVFIKLTEALWARGDDGEEIAMDLAEALRHAIREGTAARTAAEIMEEFNELLGKVDKR